jgi:hypothetical protein
MDQAEEGLTAWQLEMAVKMLRVGNTATEAAELVDCKPGQLYAAARQHDDLLLALAGHDPYAYDAQQMLQQARYVGLLALGMRPTQAARVLFHGDERVKGWRQKNATFAQVADYVRRLNPPKLLQRREHRFTPHRVKLFLDALREGMTAIRAAEEAGITNAVIYQRRRRDSAFRAAMDAARAQGLAHRERRRVYVTEAQWIDFRAGVEAGMTLRKAAKEADIEPQMVYDRRSTDPEFRAATDRWRGTPGATPEQ